MRALYSLGLLYVALCGALLWADRPGSTAGSAAAAAPHAPVTAMTGPEWFQRMKPFCNPVEVETQARFVPPPPGFEGAAYGAGCFALAGKIDRARELIAALDADGRLRAANIVFDLGHPVADAGDDKSAGPIMALVVEFSPDNYMALYHAGASEFILGQPDLARRHLTRFLDLYKQNDGWHSNAINMLRRLDGQ